MSDGDARAALGDAVLDEMLNGGIPENRTVLVTGGPGSGKSTLAMQYRQTGLAAGEDCLYVGTEQTIGELRDSFSGFSFDVDHENLTFVSVHATLGQTTEGDDELALQSLDDEELLLHVTSPETIDDCVAPFYRSTTDQVLDIWLEDGGLQYVTLQKSPCGFVGSTSLVEYVDEPPYLRVQRPPGTRENPYACE
ncbi:RAD55 family ATPase [Salinigranum marinum]|uniref:RAD55 family ATPase n=1 Tax=Salinigranum marinum TaxID=1515595 RepID=UPI002989B973|nr:ATPase domain-containing protein [Salinigranum marinum]